MQTAKGAVFTMVLIGAGLAGFGWWQFGGISLTSGEGEHGHEEHGEEYGSDTLPESIAARLDGRILEVEYEHEDGRAVYEVELIDDEGRRRKLLVDPDSGAVIGRER